MGIDQEDYDKWKKEYEAKGGEPCLTNYCLHLVYKDTNSIPKNKNYEDEKLKEKIRENQHLLNELCK